MVDRIGVLNAWFSDLFRYPGAREVWDEGIGYDPEYASVMQQASKAIQAMLHAARIYFKDPLAVRAEIQKVHFHEAEATTVSLRVGRQIFDSDSPLEIKRYLADWLLALRTLGSDAGDVADLLAILAVKRS